MKKILFAAVALVAVSFASCTGCTDAINKAKEAADSILAADSAAVADSLAALNADSLVDVADSLVEDTAAFE